MVGGLARLSPRGGSAKPQVRSTVGLLIDALLGTRSSHVRIKKILNTGLSASPMKRVSVALGLLAGLLALPAHADKYCEQTENFKQADEANCRLAIEGKDLLDDGIHGVRGGVPPCRILISGDGRQLPQRWGS